MQQDAYADDTTEATFMAKVYRWMALGLALTGLTAFGVFSSPALAQVIIGNRLVFFGLLIAELLMVVAFMPVLKRASFGTAAAMFLAYCALSGLTFSVYLFAYTGQSVANVFFVTGGTFLGMSAYGTLTKKDLTSWGSFLMMGLFGMIIAGVVNLFVRSDALGFVFSCIGVVVFTGLTAYDTQKIRGYARAGDDRYALSGALNLYLDFVNLFISLLRLFGKRR
ncbi:MAG: Bax inhibitor-1/YccA family protein [Deltaproteobacteria bacterium]|nr:Bax inhibitor-1/YccA family protein [Deltaproteobacteria bacterium]